MTSKIEYRTNPFRFSLSESRDAGGKSPGTISGYAARFDSESYDLGGFTETIRPGAFAKALDNISVDCVALRDHDQSQLLGRRSAGTLTLWQDQYGLCFRVTLPATQLGFDTAELVRRGDLNGCSFSFAEIRDSWDFSSMNDRIVRTIESIGELLDVSCVTYPAYGKSSVGLGSTPSRRMSPRLPASLQADLDRLRLIETRLPR